MNAIFDARLCAGALAIACASTSPPADAPAPTSPDETARVLAQACEAGVAAKCVELGQAYSEGGTLPHDAVRADQAFAKACRLDPLFCD